MPLSDHDRPLTEHERRVLAAIEAGLTASARSRRRRWHLIGRSLLIGGLGLAEIAVLTIAGVGLLPVLAAAILAGSLGSLFGAAAAITWTRRRGVHERAG